MDPILQVLLSWQFVLFSLAVAAVMYVFRIVVEYIFSFFKVDPKNPKWWNDLVLPILPVFIGAFGALHFQSFPYPDGLTTHGDRLIFGLVAGLLSTLLYRVFKALLYQKIQGLVQALPGAVPMIPGMPVPQIPPPVTQVIVDPTVGPTVPVPTPVTSTTTTVSMSVPANLPFRGSL
jgi:hypothetical protein